MNYKSDFKTRPLKKAIFIIASCQIRVVESLISTGTKKSNINNNNSSWNHRSLLETNNLSGYFIVIQLLILLTLIWHTHILLRSSSFFFFQVLIWENKRDNSHRFQITSLIYFFLAYQLVHTFTSSISSW